MNKERRATLASIAAEVDNLKEAIEVLVGHLEDVKSEEQEAFDNMPESLQQGERGQEMEEGLSKLDDAMSDIQDAQHAIDELVTALSELF